MREREDRPPAAATLDAVAAALPGRVLVLGHVRPSLLRALWEHAERVDHVVDQGQPYARAAAEAGVRHHHWRAIGFADAADAVLVDVDRSDGFTSFVALRSRLRPGGVLGLFGSAGRGPSARATPFASFVALERALTDAGFTFRPHALADARHAFVLGTDARPPAPRVRVSPASVPVTVAIPSAGRSPWLREAIESVLSQSAPPADVLVVSDGGGEDVRAVTRAFPTVTLVERGERGGQAAAMNDALERVSTPYVAWLDDDDRFRPQKLAVQWRDLEAHPEAAFSATDHVAIDASGVALERAALPAFDPAQALRLLLGGSYFLGPTVMVPMARYHALGLRPYDETLPRAADYPVWLSLAALGSVRALPLALSDIRRHRDNRLGVERIAGMRESAQRALRHARAAWPLDRVFPAITAARTEDERSDAIAVALIERAGQGLRVGLVREAIEDLERGLAERPEDARLRHFLALALMESGQLDAATQAFEAAGRVGAPQVEVCCGLGTIAVWRGDEADAARWFGRARAADPHSVLARYNALWLRHGEGDAVELCRELLASGRPHGYLLSPAPPLPPTDRLLVRMRRAENGLPVSG